MKKYQQLAQQLTEQIALGVWLPGDRLPSLREQVISSGMSFMTVSHAYQLLESQGRIVARPQSGYYVAPQPVKLRQPAPPAQVTRDEAVDINTYIFEVLQASRQASMLPFASAFPDPRLFPLQQLNRSLAQVSKTSTAMSVIENLPPGNAELRHAIARRYALQGMNVSPDEIVITAGALEALNLSLQAVTEPGDWVVVENPCFYGALQALERLRLKALSVATDVREGIDLTALEAALQNYPVKACWLMTNGQNPLGFTLSAEKKAALVALLARYNVMLIEDDVYSELYFGREKPLPAKFWDRQEMTLHCSSFSKCLVPGFRIGWVAAGKQARRIQQLQLMSTLQQAWQALLRHLPPEVIVHHSDSGYFLWIELPEGADASALSVRALASHISIAPGKMFSTSDSWTSFFRFNTAWGWGEREEQGVKRLGELIREQLV
ncbi:TPA: PLP-dependent aminotransferase family protein [Klebsiella pneumoniae]|nr:PLP-dependent aminotransferase family protein [Klebsiella pneumoniae]HBZ0821072.1 PLP-dependent aminotransferase family protein [Klebsiella pneumoniae]